MSRHSRELFHLRIHLKLIVNELSWIMDDCRRITSAWTLGCMAVTSSKSFSISWNSACRLDDRYSPTFLFKPVTSCCSRAKTGDRVDSVNASALLEEDKAAEA